MTTRIELLAQSAYDAHRAARSEYVPPWEDLTENERRAWQAAISVVAGEAASTVSEPPRGKSLILKVGNERHAFDSDFTVGRDGALVIEDDFASGQHARFQTVRGLWYVEDLGSTNGTEINGHRFSSAQLLRKRDKITIGHTVITVVSA